MSWNMVLPLLLAISVVPADDVPKVEQVTRATEAQVQAQAKTEAKTQVQTEEGAKVISGMSILGNQEAPKSLVIVPWKSSVLPTLTSERRAFSRRFRIRCTCLL